MIRPSGRWGLTAKQAPTGPAPPRRSVCARERCLAILSQTNLERENRPCHSTVGCRTSDPPSRRAGANAITGDGARFEPRRIGPTSKSWKTAALPAFLAPVDYPVGAVPHDVKAADFNGDAHPDLATANSGSNTVSVLLGNADGTFQPARDTATDAGSVIAGRRRLQRRRQARPGDGATTTVPAATASSVLLGHGDGTFAHAVPPS